MRVFVAGATGVLGRRTIPLLLAAGHQVVGLVRDADRAAFVRSLGAEASIGTLFDRDAISRAADGCEAMLHLATRIPRAIRTATRDWTQNDRVRVEGTTSLIAAAKPAGVRYYVQESVIFIYGDHGDEWITENTPIPHTQPSILRSAVEMERIVEHSALPHVILRSGAFYGSETGTTEMMLESVRHRALPLVGNGRAFMSLIHVEDIARAVTAALTRRLEGTFNIVDTEPVRQEEFLTYAARLLGARSPWRIPSWLARLAGGAGSAVVLRSQRVSSEKARTALGFTFAYPTFREGLAEAARYLLP